MEDKTMKKYIKPETNMTNIQFEAHLMNGSGVKTGGTLHEEYTLGDVTYTRKSFSAWDDEEEE